MKTLAAHPKHKVRRRLRKSRSAAFAATMSKPAAKLDGRLPDDLAANHDFYLYGTHKQQPRRGRWIPPGKPVRKPTRAQVAAFNRKMAKLAADLEGLPPDLAKNLDHYLHGHPKR